MFTMPFEFGAIVLVPFPFTSQAALKRRPAVVVSRLDYGAIRGDIIVMAVTSQIRADPALREVPVVQWQDAGLLKPSVIKPVLATLEEGLVRRTLRVLGPGDQTALRAGIARILG